MVPGTDSEGVKPELSKASVIVASAFKVREPNPLKHILSVDSSSRLIIDEISFERPCCLGGCFVPLHLMSVALQLPYLHTILP